MKIQKMKILLLLLCLLLFAGACGGRRERTIFQGRRGSASTLKEKTEEVLAEQDTQKEEEKGDLSGLYLLKKIDMDKKTVYLMKVSNGRQAQYDYDTATMFLDKYGNSKSQASFISGEAVEIQISSKTDLLQKLWVTDRVWVQDEITNYSVAEESHAITIGKTKYSYDEDLPIFSNDVLVSFDDLISEDEIRAVGIDKKIISLSITQGHGYLALANTKLFDGSFICIGDKIFEEVEPDKIITVPEGKYVVTVANDGYGGSRDVTIERDVTTSLNLDELKGEGPKTCKITFHVGVEGAVLMIDNEKVDYSKPVEVRYGIHSIAVGAEGYDTIKQKLVVNSKEAEIEIGLTQTDTSTETADNSQSNNNNSGSSNTNNNNNNNNNSNNNNSNHNNNNNNNNNNNSNNNTNNNNNNNNNNNSSDNSSSTDYLTTLYNLLTSINESDGSSNSSNNNNSNKDDTRSRIIRRYDEFEDE